MHSLRLVGALVLTVIVGAFCGLTGLVILVLGFTVYVATAVAAGVVELLVRYRGVRRWMLGHIWLVMCVSGSFVGGSTFLVYSIVR